ncbi:glycosyltransferase family 15 protein [Cylindrobasidium torrendii FP15055 ss-10]|uniref:Glycosyltransferase family 15 protein n=1 Tax=Cylindrobasidium torrendii FP15055 ss-10 TaxID=1314674 RepID=A0A0D7BEC8_9AGAR|nr:glycosyltransferase family 15 protein [Cylindrobasidium torrendii FP15055 ss-10]
MGNPMTIAIPASSQARRIVGSILVVVLTLHTYLYFTGRSYTSVLSESNAPALPSSSAPALPESWHAPWDTDASSDLSASAALPSSVVVNTQQTEPHQRANATFVMLCRNTDLNGVVSSMQSVEDRFNRKYGYGWILLNDEEFTEEFIERVSVITKAPIQFGRVPPEMWVQPAWIDEERARKGRLSLVAQRVIYGGSVSYRNMCRFNSGFFYKHELLLPYRYYWRVEPDVQFFCDIEYDPFRFMQDEGKIYGWTISLLEWEATIPSLWTAVKEFITRNPQYLHEDNAMEFVSADGGATYNQCHFWSNFEIADMEFWRGEAYEAFFQYLEAKGGFYYERWGDAPVHSIAAALFAPRDKLHFFRDIGYRHEHFQHCPARAPLALTANANADAEEGEEDEHVPGAPVGKVSSHVGAGEPGVVGGAAVSPAQPARLGVDHWKEGRCACDPNDSFEGASWGAPGDPTLNYTKGEKFVDKHIEEKHSGYRFFCNIPGCTFSVAYPDKDDIQFIHAYEHEGRYEGETLRNTITVESGTGGKLKRSVSSFSLATIPAPSEASTTNAMTLKEFIVANVVKILSSYKKSGR